MKRVYSLFVVVVVLCIGISASFAIGASNTKNALQEEDPVKRSLMEAVQYEEEQPIDLENPKYCEEGDRRELLINDPTPIFEGNANFDDYYDIDQVIDQMFLDSVHATVITKNVMTYKDYRNRVGDDGELTAIDDDHLLWVLQIYYPEGYETKKMTFADATVTGIYDAETGFYFGYSVTGNVISRDSPPVK